jgi:hypothetical protein
MKKAFALIELPAAILFPVFAQAKVAAKKTSDLSNTKQLGVAVQIYLQECDDVLPPANHRVAGSIQEVHWSWMMLPYVKNEQIFASPWTRTAVGRPGASTPRLTTEGMECRESSRTGVRSRVTAPVSTPCKWAASPT